MDPTLLTKLAQATTDAERQSIVLEMSLAQLPTELLEAVKAAAIPHWFDFNYLSALIGEENCDLIYDELLEQSFVEHIPGRGYAIHERTRLPLLNKMWSEDESNFKLLSKLAAEFCTTQTDHSYWLSEEIYHRLISDIDVGLIRFQEMATSWANFEQSSYEDVEQVTRLAEQHIVAGRLSGSAADWIRLWQARLNLLYGQLDQAANSLNKVVAGESDPIFKAEFADTQGDLEAANQNLEAAAAFWKRSITVYSEQNKAFEAYLVEEKLRASGLIDHARLTTADNLKSTDSFRLQLLDNIEDAWINGVLRQVLTPTQKGLDLPLAQERAISGNLKVNRPGSFDQSLNQNGELSRLFNASGRSLLILGAPGSGKTITLLELLDELIELARNNKNEPIPLLFNLSSFGKFDGELIDWLSEQISNQYSVSSTLARNQILGGNGYTLLLDGLDEIPNETSQRDRSVSAINEYMQAHPTGLAICSRITDYRDLNSRLAISNSVVIQPLTNGQIEQTLQAVGRGSLNSLIEKHWRLREALRSPLVLNLFPKAVPDSAIQSLESADLSSLEEWQQEIFGRYADRVLPSQKDDDSSYWLKNLASGMQSAGTSVFNIEDLQSFWLSADSQDHFFATTSGALTLLIGLLVGTIISGSVLDVGVFWSPVLGVLYAIGASGIAYLATRLSVSIDQDHPRSFAAGGLTWLILIPFTATGVLLLISSIDNIVPGIIIGAVFGLGIAISVALNVFKLKIIPKEKVQFHAPQLALFRKYLPEFLFITVAFTIIGGLTGPIFEDGQLNIAAFIETVSWISPFTLFSGIICWVGLATIGTPEIDERHVPGQGIRASFLNSLLITGLATIVFGISGLIMDRGYEANGVFVGMILATVLPITFAWYGGTAWVQHWVLRWMLDRKNTLPFELNEWLNKMVEAGLLRRAGGGYIFIHRSLLEFFADS